ncbi:MAG TPA: protein kinase [Kofleriaceae bacterium]
MCPVDGSELAEDTLSSPQEHAPSPSSSTESVTLRRIEPVKLPRSEPDVPSFAVTTEVDQASVSDSTDPEGEGVADVRSSDPEPRTTLEQRPSALDLFTTTELRPGAGKRPVATELRPSSPELEAALAPPTFDAPPPLDTDRIARARRHDTGTDRDAQRPGSTTQLSIAPRMTPRSLPTLARGTVVGDYEVDGKIGEGAMSEVYSAIHRTIGRRVAIKVISPRLFDDLEAEARFVSEARTVAAIHHPGIVDVFGFGTLDDGRMYLIMDWLHGRSLAARLREGPVPITDACEIILQITSALRAAHELGIVHRDLKPDNVFLQEVDDERLIVKLLDFGLAKRTGKEIVSHTRTGQLLGTPLYLSPEQARGKEVDASTDIYALGCIAYQLYTGRPPFIADNVADLVALHLTQPSPAPRSIVPDLPPLIDGLLQRMLEKEPAQRPSLANVRRAMQSALGVGSSAMHVVQGPTKDSNSKLPLAAPASSPPGTLPRSDEDDSLETLELPEWHTPDSPGAARNTRPSRSSGRARAIASDEPAQSRALVIVLWSLLLASVATLIWFITH